VSFCRHLQTRQGFWFQKSNYWVPIMRRLRRKVKEVISWMFSVRYAADVPVALLLSICRTRPPKGTGLYARSFQRLPDRFDIHPRKLKGFSLTINPADIAELIIYEELFIRGVYDLTVLPFEPDTVVDCGGFEGYFTLLARARFTTARFVVFEPNPANYTVMCSNFERNSVDIDTRRQAVSNRAGEMSFSGVGLGGSLVSEVGEAACVRVQVANICEVVTLLSPRRLLLKLDVEGEEDRILPDLVPLLPPTCAVFFESHHGNEGYKQLKDLFCRSGFVVQAGSIRNDTFIDAVALRCG
jgi:FkbM family methyltransferase